MRRLILTAVVSAGLLAAAAPVKAQVFPRESGADFVADCRPPYDVADRRWQAAINACNQAFFSIVSSLPVVGKDRVFCLPLFPRRPTYSEMLQSVITYLVTEPGVAKYEAFDAIATAMANVYPCQPGSAK